MDTSGRLAYSNGLQLQGWGADPAGVINTNGQVAGITLPINSTIDPSATTTLDLTGNLNSSAAVGETFTRNVQVYDSLGNPHVLEITFQKTNDNEWDYTVTPDASSTIIAGDTGTITFDPANGHLDTGGPINLTFNPGGGAAGGQGIVIDINAITQQQANESSIGYEQNGYKMGYLDSFKIDSAGKVIGVFTNGLTKDVAQLAVATFANPGGLEKLGETMFQTSSNSGEAQINPSGVGGSGKITPGTLEMSNVDLSQEFTDMIVTQRGFQANSRIITTSDEMLQELVNLKR
jgi:flagellar hook protein FlgE